MATELVVKLRVSGDKDVDAALKRVGQAAHEAGVKLTPMNQGLGRASEQTRVALRAAGDLAQTLAGTAAILSLAARGNKELQEKLQGVTVGLSAAATAINIFRNAAQLAQGATVALRIALVALSGPIGLVVAGITALVAVAAVLVKRHMDAKKAAEGHAAALDRAAASAARFTSEGRGLSHRQVELQSQLQDTTAATEKAKQVIEGMAEADREAAQAGAEKARGIREAAEALQMEIDAERLLDEINQVAVPRAQEKARAIKGLVFDAREGALAAREAAAAQAAWNEELASREMEDATQRARLLATEMRGVVLEARQVVGLTGRSTAAGLADANRVITETQSRLRGEAAEQIVVAGRIAEANQQAAIDSLNAWLASKEGIAPNWVELAQMVNEAISQIVAGQGQAMLAAQQAATAAKASWLSGIDGILQRLGVLRDTSGSIWEEIKNAAIRALVQLAASKVWEALQARFASLGKGGGGLISGALSLIPGIGPILGGIARILGLQHGGIVTKPTMAMIGEAGPEAVIPLNSSRATSMLGGGINIHIHGATFLGSQEDVRRWFQGVAGPVLRQEYAR